MAYVKLANMYFFCCFLGIRRVGMSGYMLSFWGWRLRLAVLRHSIIWLRNIGWAWMLRRILLRPFPGLNMQAPMALFMLRLICCFNLSLMRLWCFIKGQNVEGLRKMLRPRFFSLRIYKGVIPLMFQNKLIKLWSRKKFKRNFGKHWNRKFKNRLRIKVNKLRSLNLEEI